MCTYERNVLKRNFKKNIQRIINRYRSFFPSNCKIVNIISYWNWHPILTVLFHCYFSPRHLVPGMPITSHPLPWGIQKYYGNLKSHTFDNISGKRPYNSCACPYDKYKNKFAVGSLVLFCSRAYFCVSNVLTKLYLIIVILCVI